MWRAAAHASDRPSNVLVPRPTSSMSTRLARVALFRMFAVSVISTMNVERPPVRSSAAPMRVKIRSIEPIVADSAGTTLPMCARIAISAVWRMYVDLPPMFGPVMISMRVVLARARDRSARTARALDRSTPRWRPPRYSSRGSSTSVGSTRSSALRRARRGSRACRARRRPRPSRCSAARSRAERVEQLVVELLLARQRALARATAPCPRTP